MRSSEMAATRAAAQLAGLLPDHLGQFRVAQWYWWRRRPEHRVLRQRMADGTWLALDLGDRTQALAFLTRRYSEDLVRQIVGRLPEKGLFFDVGANVGLISFQVAHRRPDIRIVAFEPHPKAASAWRGNHQLSSEDIEATLVETAVGDRAGILSLESPSSDLGAGIVAGKRDDGLPVQVIALDDYCAAQGINRIDVMKLDVEGSEPEALAGARKLLASGAIRLLIVEFNDGHFARRGISRRAMVQWLADHGMAPCGSIAADDVAFSPTG